MRNTKFYIVIAILIASCSISFSQEEEEKESPFSANVDLMSRYVWRGTDFGGSPSLQPTLDFSKSGISVGAWGAFSTNFPGSQELDLYVFYTFMDDMFSIGVTDYFFPSDLTSFDNYFEYDGNKTGHIFEITAKFNGTEKLPLSLMIASNVFGADVKKYNSDGTPTDDIMYSTYAELAYSFKNLDVFAGFNVIDPNEKIGESGFYGNAMGFVNIGCTASKEIKITDDYSLPLSVSFITNPQSEKVFLVVGASF